MPGCLRLQIYLQRPYYWSCQYVSHMYSVGMVRNCLPLQYIFEVHKYCRVMMCIGNKFNCLTIWHCLFEMWKSWFYRTILLMLNLTHWGRVTHIYVTKISIIGSGNGLSSDRRQAIIWTNAGILLIGTLGTNVNEILIEIDKCSFKNIHLKMSSGKWRPFCLGLNVLSCHLPGH